MPSAVKGSVSLGYFKEKESIESISKPLDDDPGSTQSESPAWAGDSQSLCKGTARCFPSRQSNL